MKLIVGLGNIGAHFEGTRHNVGFSVLENLASDWQEKSKFKAHIAELTLGEQKIILAKPTTYYNQTGQAVVALKNFYKLHEDDILVVHDELALPFGTVRIRLKGSDAGNNGIKSIIEAIGPNFPRVRIGIANQLSQKADAADFVLSRFSHDENQALPQVIRLATDFIHQFVDKSLTQTSTKL